MRKRIFAAFVCLCMLMALVPSMAYAGDMVYTGGLCEHHTQHDDACGYSEGTAEVPCSHEHTEDCYQLVTNCVHEHTAECYSDGVLPADGEEKTADSCSHQCSEESGCITKELNCNHEHDASCGYVPATAGTSCTYVCEICNAQAVEEPECNCDTKCTEEEVNADCPLCSVEGAELDKVCVGAAPMLSVTTLAGEAKQNVSYIYYTWNDSDHTLIKHDGQVSTATEVTASDTVWGANDGQEHWYVVSGTVEISGRVTVTGNVHLILADGCSLTVSNGIQVSDDDNNAETVSLNSFTIYGQSDGTGELTASAANRDAGIGGSEGQAGGTIIIYGGNINASSGSGAGIGGGSAYNYGGSANGGTIIIYGGDIIAKSTRNGAGIGGGYGYNTNGGNITIYGGTVNATSGSAEGANYSGAGIGGGGPAIDNIGSGGVITIHGGNITAQGGSRSAGIGGGLDCEGGTITISGGVINATGGDCGAGIGGGGGDFGGTGGTITISGGTVTAKSTGNGAGIGGGGVVSEEYATTGGDGGTIIISGGTVTATSPSGAGIGGGCGPKGNGSAAAFSTGTGGNAVIFASGSTAMGDIQDNPDMSNWRGMFFLGSEAGKIYGTSFTFTENFTFPSGKTLHIEEGKELSIDTGVTLINRGTVNNNGIVNNSGIVANGGTITNEGTWINKVTSIKMIQNSNNLFVGDSTSFAAQVTRGIVSGNDVGNVANESLTWSSDPADIVEITPNMTDNVNVNAVKAGTATITVATADYKYMDTCEVTVKEKTIITTQPQDMEVQEGESATFTVVATGGNLTYQWQQRTNGESNWTNIDGANLPTYTTGQTTMDMNGYQYRCIVMGEDGNVTSDSVTLTVKAIPVASIKLNKTAATLFVEDVETLIATVEPTNATNKTVTWSSSNNNVATVDQNGNVKAISRGEAVITATAADGQGAKAECKVTVRKKSSGGSVFFWDLKFDTNGGSDIDTVTEWEYSTIDLDEYVPEKEGYKFVGWYADKDFDKKIDEVYLTEDTTVYAKWEKIEEEVPEEPEETEETEPISFLDVKERDWFYDAVSYAVENGLMSGMSEDIFSPNTPLTREMLAVVLYNVEGQPESTEANTFTDVKGDMWYTDAILWANENGIVAGYDNGAYGVGDFITREQFAAILYRYAQFKGYDTTQGGMAVREFSDYENISDYARPAMAWAVNAGIMGGMDDGTLMPQGKATRAEAATMLMNFCENVMK